MKTKNIVLALALLALPTLIQAQFNYTTNNGAITITAYTGSGGNVTIPDTINGYPVTSIGDSAFYYRSTVTSVTIGNSVTSIGNVAFYSCTSLASVTIPDSVTSIGSAAFDYCTSLTSVTIGSSVTNIAGNAFGGCTSLAAITVDTNNPAYSSEDGVLFNRSQTTLILCPAGKAGSYTIPNSVTSIGYAAFYYCASLTSVTIPNSVTTIGSHAFEGCSSLTSVTIPNSVTSIEDQAFGSCSSLTSVTIPASVTSIWRGAFDSCSSLTSVTIPASVTSIESGAFYGCYSLTRVYFEGNAPPSFGGFDVFFGDNNATVYYLPGTVGWGATFGGRPTALWLPQVKSGDASFGVQTNQFGFNITWASGRVVVVEASTDPGHPVWSPVATNTLTGGASYFSDPQWTNYPARFYRLRSP